MTGITRMIVDRALRQRLVAHIRVIGTGPLDGAAVALDRTDVYVHAVGDGHYALATRGASVSGASVSGQVTISVRAQGFRDAETTASLAPGLVVDVGTLVLSPNPVRICGSIASTDGAVVPGAVIELEGGTGAEHPLALRTPIGVDAASGTSVTSHLAVGTGSSLRLRGSARPGDHVLWVFDRSGVTPGALLRYGRVYLRVSALPSSPELIELAAPIVRGIEADVPVELVTLGPATSTTALARPARRGDGILWLTGPVGAGVVQLGGVAAVASPGLDVVDGDFVIDGVTWAVDLRAIATGMTHDPATPIRTFSRHVQHVALRMKPTP